MMASNMDSAIQNPEPGLLATHALAADPSAIVPCANVPEQWHRSRLLLYARLIENFIDVWPEEIYRETFVDCGPALGNAIVLNEPKEISRIFRDRSERWSVAWQQQRICRSLFGGETIATATGSAWAADRHHYEAALAEPTLVELTGYLHRNARQLASRLLARGASGPINSEVARYSLKGIAAIGMSWREDRFLDEFADEMWSAYDTIGRVSVRSFFRFAGLLPTGSQGRGDRVARKLRHRITEEIGARKRDQTSRQDLLQFYLDSGGRGTDTIPNMLALLSSGYDTTSAALSWHLYILGQLPDLQQRLRTELAGLFDEAGRFDEKKFRELVVTRAVFREIVRLYPSLPLLARVCRQGDEVCGRRIEPGRTVFVSPYVLHRHRKHWRDPGQFDASRFMPGSASKPVEGAYIPFGVGKRSCPGFRFAYREIVVALAVLLGSCRLVTDTGRPVRLRSGLGLGTFDGLHVDVQPL